MAQKKIVHQLNATVNITNVEKKESRNRKPYDDRKVEPGDVLVPMLATNEQIKLLGANRANICTWKNADRAYHVMFYPVPKSAKKLAMQQFSSELNEFLGKNHEDKTMESLDALLDVGFEPAPSPSAEDIFMEGELFAELMQELHGKYPIEEQVVSMSLDDKDEKAILESLKLSKSQDCNVISQTIALVERIIRS